MSKFASKYCVSLHAYLTTDYLLLIGTNPSKHFGLELEALNDLPIVPWKTEKERDNHTQWELNPVVRKMPNLTVSSPLFTSSHHLPEGHLACPDMQ